MNWIKNNPFVSALAGITVVICAILFFLASKAGSKYDAAKAEYDEAAARVATSESLPLYPKIENRDGKAKALGEYRDAINELRSLYEPYRVDELPTVPPEEFTATIKKSTAEVSEALEAAGATVPEGFLLGFETYANRFATEKATGLLRYELDGIKHALLKLAEARPSALLSIYREALPEEAGGTATIAPNQVARPFSFEISFKGSEAAARSFLTALGETEPYYYTVRTLKVENERTTPPKVDDAKFEKPKDKAAPGGSADNPFGGAFGAFGDIADSAASAEEEAPAEGAVAEEPAAAEVDSTRILAQVLGSEEVIVFVRFDLMMFLPEEELPKP